MPSFDRTAARLVSSPLRRALPLLLVALACTSTVEPLPGVTLQVRNATCEPGPCQAIRVLAFPANQPLTPAGEWSLDLGVITGAVGCVTLPATASFRVTDAGTGSATVTTWTTGDPVSLGPWPPNATLFTANPTTSSFVAANATSWSVTLPGADAPVPAEVCAP